MFKGLAIDRMSCHIDSGTTVTIMFSAQWRRLKLGQLGPQETVVINLEMTMELQNQSSVLKGNLG